jgi:hypothetical protein
MRQRRAERAQQLDEAVFQVTRCNDTPAVSKNACISGSQSRTSQVSVVDPLRSRESSENGVPASSTGASATTRRLMPFLNRSIGSSVTSRPWSITPIQSHMRSSSCTRWLEMNTVAPRWET